jgi:hypothetical protein
LYLSNELFLAKQSQISEADQRSSPYFAVAKHRSICAPRDVPAINCCSDALADPHYDNWREKWAVLRSLLRKNAPDLPVEDLGAFLNTPQGPHKFATILSQQAKQLLAMDRYERRALSRRKSAIRVFDATRQRPIDCNN